MGPGLEDVNLLGAGLWEDAGLGGSIPGPEKRLVPNQQCFSV